MKFTDQIKKFTNKADLLTTQVYQKSCAQVSIDIAEGSPVSTGRLVGSWAPSNGSSGSYNFSGGRSAWSHGNKNKGIADTNKAAAMSDLKPRIGQTTENLSKKDKYYFTNDVPYIQQAEHEGWAGTDSYHMRENAVLNWKLIVDSEVMKLKK